MSDDLPHFATLKFIDQERNFGWLKPDSGGESLFVRADEFALFDHVEVGRTRCRYDLEQGARGPRAVNIRPIGSAVFSKAQ